MFQRAPLLLIAFLFMTLAAGCAGKPPPTRAKAPAPTGGGRPSIIGLPKVLQDYQEIAAKGGWPMVPNVDKLEKGAQGEAVSVLRKRLMVTGDLPKGKDGDLYDDAVVEGVQRFQMRHGLEPDGAVGKDTLQALNVPVEERIHQIQVNLARKDSMPEETANRYVVVNIPDFRLKVIENGKPALGMKVVLGQRKQWQTPLIDSQIKYLILNPKWNVPAGIFAKELIYDLRKDPTYLERHRMKVVSVAGEVDPATIDWNTVSAKNPQMRIVQREGAGNSLGRIKFMFPNPYDVYLHDTPQKKLFARNMRALSHGCVRVEQPLDLATYLLSKDDGSWTREKIESAINTGRNRDIPLATPIPVHIIYRTAWVDEAGSPNFRNDIYGRDEGAAAEVAPAGKSF